MPISRSALPVLSLGLFALLPAQQSSAVIVLTADITHAQETAPNGELPLLTSGGAPRALSFGTATLTLNDAQTQLTMTATIFNIDVTGTQTPGDTNDNLVSAHIHAGLIGVNGGVVWGFFGTPANNNNPNDGVVTPFAQGVGGTFTGTWDAPEGNNTTLAAQLNAILSGGTYLNFHTTQFGGGEIRGQIVPEPGVMALGTVIVAAGMARRRRRARS